MLSGLVMWREPGDPSPIALGLNYIRLTAIKLGLIVQAQTLLEESLALNTQINERWGVGTAYCNMGLVALANGDTETAKFLLLKSLEVFDKYIEGWDIARSLIYLGDAHLLAGDKQSARESYLSALPSALEAKSNPLAQDALLGLVRLHLQDGETEMAFELTSLVSDHPHSTYETRESANQLLAKLGKASGIRHLKEIKQTTAGQSLERSIVDILKES